MSRQMLLKSFASLKLRTYRHGKTFDNVNSKICPDVPLHRCFCHRREALCRIAWGFQAPIHNAKEIILIFLCRTNSLCIFKKQWQLEQFWKKLIPVIMSQTALSAVEKLAFEYCVSWMDDFHSSIVKDQLGIHYLCEVLRILCREERTIRSFNSPVSQNAKLSDDNISWVQQREPVKV